MENKLRITSEEPSKTDSDLSELEKRIRELELSIASLDDELERFEIEKMNSKTREVKERMSIVSLIDEDDVEKVLNSELRDTKMWAKYMISTK